MPIAPRLEAIIAKKLREINPHLVAKWHRKFERWEIWFDHDTSKLPRYIILTTNKITSETFDDLRKSFWYSQRGYKQFLLKTQYEAEQRKKKAEEDEFDTHYQMGKEAVPLLKTLKDAGASSHGQSKFMFHGYGEGR